MNDFLKQALPISFLADVQEDGRSANYNSRGSRRKNPCPRQSPLLLLAGRCRPLLCQSPKQHRLELSCPPIAWLHHNVGLSDFVVLAARSTPNGAVGRQREAMVSGCVDSAEVGKSALFLPASRSRR